MSRVLLDLGFIQIYWYSVCILIGMMIGMYLVYREAARQNISENLITNLIFYTVIIAIFGARIYYVAFNWNYYSSHMYEILEIWNGGLAIHGAIILGGLFLIYYTKKHKLDTLKILDICCVGLIIGQVCGRWGNFFNQEAYGAEVSLDFLKSLHLPGFIIDGIHINGAYYHPTFLYESLWCILGFVLLILYRKKKYLKTGQIFGIYCMWYGLGRFFIEGLRVDSLMIGSLKAAQIVSIGMFVTGLFFFIRRFKTGRFDYLYNETSQNIDVQKSKTGKSVPFVTQHEKATEAPTKPPLMSQPETSPPTEPSIISQPETTPPTEPQTIPQPETTPVVESQIIPQSDTVPPMEPQLVPQSEVEPMQPQMIPQPETTPVVESQIIPQANVASPIQQQIVPQPMPQQVIHQPNAVPVQPNPESQINNQQPTSKKTPFF